MANSDEKNNASLAWSHRVPGRNAPKDFPTPDVSAVIMPGLPLGLLPRASLDNDITLKVDSWGNLPDDGETEIIELQIAREGSLEYQTIDTVTYVQGTTVLPFEIKIPSDFLLNEENEGAFKIRFEHENWAGTPTLSGDAIIVIDKIPPNFPNYPGEMTFDFGLGPIYDTTLAGLTEIEGTIPAWTHSSEGDKVAFTWLADQLPEDPALIVPIGVVELGADRKVKIPVGNITSGPDGKYCAGYYILDKAGNRSLISLYDLIPVALGALPTAPLPAPVVPEAQDGVVNRTDANSGVYVEFPRIVNGKPTDQIEITWGSKALDFKTPVGTNPDVFSIAVPLQHIKNEYGSATTVVHTPLSYKVYRGAVDFSSDSATVPVDFSMTGPDNPGWPDPVNPALEVPNVFGASATANELVAGDENQRVYAAIVLVDPLTDGDAYQVYWNNVPIGTPYVIDTSNDSAGDAIEVDLAWDVIKSQGNNPSMPVHYALSNPLFGNEQESDRRPVRIEFLTVTLPSAIAQNTIRDRLTCLSLHYEAGAVGFQYLIPPSEYLKEGMTVEVEWKAYNTYSAPVPIPTAGKTATLGPINAAQALAGVIWFVEPYDVHILPTWGGPTDQTGKAEVVYTLQVNGQPAPSVPSDTQVVLSAGSGTCVLTPTP